MHSDFLSFLSPTAPQLHTCAHTHVCSRVYPPAVNSGWIIWWSMRCSCFIDMWLRLLGPAMSRDASQCCQFRTATHNVSLMSIVFIELVPVCVSNLCLQSVMLCLCVLFCHSVFVFVVGRDCFFAHSLADSVVCVLVGSLFVVYPCVTLSHQCACHYHGNCAVTYARFLTPWLTVAVVKSKGCWNKSHLVFFLPLIPSSLVLFIYYKL